MYLGAGGRGQMVRGSLLLSRPWECPQASPGLPLHPGCLLPGDHGQCTGSVNPMTNQRKAGEEQQGNAAGKQRPRWTVD